MATMSKEVEERIDELELVNTWDELKDFEKFGTLKQALKEHYKHREYHRLHNLKKKVEKRIIDERLESDPKFKAEVEKRMKAEGLI